MSKRIERLIFIILIGMLILGIIGIITWNAS